MPIAQMSKKLSNVCTDGCFKFCAKNQHKGVKVYVTQMKIFFGLGRSVSDLWPIK